MRSASAWVGARGFDTVATISAEEAAKMKAAGLDFAVRYLPSLTAAEAKGITDAGLALMGVTYGRAVGSVPAPGDGTAKAYSSVQEAKLIGLPNSSVIWLDLEGAGGTSDQTVAFCKEFYDECTHWGCEPGIYVGAQPNMTSAQLYSLPFRHYWKGQSQLYNAGVLVEPNCGWQMVQLFPSIKVADTLVDVNFIQQDYKGRLPIWGVKD